MRNVIKNQMLPQFKLEDVLSATMTTCSTTTCTTTSSESSSSSSTSAPVEAGSAWTQGTHFGTSAIAKYTTLPEEEDMKTVDLVLGNDEIVVGDVEIVRDGDTLFVTLSTDEPYIMSEAHLYVDDTPPTNSAPGQLGHTFDPGFFFTTHTFEVDISGLSGTLYIAAHAVVFVFE